MSEFIEVLSPSALKDLQALNSEIVKTIAGVKEVNSNMISIKTPSGSDSAMKALTAQYDAQAKNMQTLQKALEKEQQERRKTVQTILDQSKSYQALEKQRNLAIAQAEKESAKLAILDNVYSKVQAKLNAVSNEYKDLATRKELGIKLTDDEAKRYEFLLTKITKYDTTLKAVDATMGKYQRNVGNYASGFNPLGSSIGRIAQELPNLGQSFQIFAMSIGNNIAAFKDAISGIIAQNKLLQAEGKATSSVMSQIGSSLFSLNTALYVGIAVFIAYGKEIGEWASGLFAGNKALEELTASQVEFNKARTEGRKGAQAEILELRKYLAVINDEKLTTEQRKIAQDALLKQYPFYIRTIKDAMLVDGQYSQGVKDLIVSLEKRKEVEKKSELNVINRQKLIDLEKELEAQLKLEKIAKQSLDRGVKNQISGQALATLSDAYNKILQKRIDTEKSIDAITKQSIKNDADIIKLKKETIGLEYQEEKVKKDGTKAKRDDVEAVKLEIEAQDGLLKKIKLIRDGFIQLRQSQSNTNEEFKEFTELIEYYDKLIDSIEKDALAESAKTGSDEFLRLNRNMADTSDKTKELTDNMKDFLRQFTEGFFSNAGLPTLFKALNNEIEGFGENFAVTFTSMAEIVQEAFNFMSEASNAHFANEYANLEKQRNVAIMFAGESASAREEIERQYEIRQREIKQREFKAKKQQAIFNIILDTAQGIVSALASTPPNVPLSIAIGVIGALQLATVSSQQTPQYEHGTDNHIGGAMIINDQKGSNYKEIVETPDGKKKIYEGRNVRVNAPKGTKVKTASETMDYLMFNSDLNNILTGNGISNPKVELNTTAIDLSPVVNAINNKAEFSQLISNGDLKTVVKKHNETVEVMNRRINFKGNNV